MKKEKRFAFDLKAAREKTGLRQLDCAHLLGVSESRISHFETGVAPPTTRQMLALSIIYGNTMEVLASGLLDEVMEGLIERLQTMPPASQNLFDRSLRADTLSQLAIRLEALTNADHGAL